MADPVGEARERLEKLATALGDTRFNHLPLVSQRRYPDLAADLCAVLSSLRPSASQLGSPSHRTDGDGETSSDAPDLPGFVRAVLRCLWDGDSLDGGDLQELGLEHRVIRQTTFDPARHTDHLGVGVEPGDEWFEAVPLAASPLPPVDGKGKLGLSAAWRRGIMHAVERIDAALALLPPPRSKAGALMACQLIRCELDALTEFQRQHFPADYRDAFALCVEDHKRQVGVCPAPVERHAPGSADCGSQRERAHD